MLRRRLPRAVLSAVAVLSLSLVTGCTSSGTGAGAKFTPVPDYQGNVDPNPQLPNPGIPQPSVPNGVAPSPGPSGSRSSAATDPSVVATKLDEPTGLVVLPDGTALVGERKSGKIFRVQPTPGKPVVLVQTLAGVDGAGDGGLLDLAISPTYPEDGLVYAYLSTATDNRVVHFALGSAPSVVIGAIPHGVSGNGGRIAFDATGALLTGTGDAGHPELAGSTASLAGKILRTDDIGKAAPNNPVAGSRVYARGLHGADGVDGLCVDARTGTRVAISGEQVLLLKAGADYASAKPAAVLPATASGGGGCALVGSQLLVATSTGKSLAAAPVGANATIGTFTLALTGSYGRLRTVVAGSDGALWLTTRNRDGKGNPVATDDRVLRITSLDTASPVV